MAKRYRVTTFVRVNNAVMSSLLRLGVQLGGFALLTVRGRKSGKPIMTPVAIFAHDGNSYLIAAYGLVNWVRNLRAAQGEATLTRGGRAETIHAIELPLEEAAAVFRESLRSGPPGIPVAIIRVYRRYFVLPYLNVGANSSLAEFEREAPTHPVFLVQFAQ